MKLVQSRFQDFAPDEKFDLIVSNPPYFPDHLKSPDPKRNQALHTDELSFRDLLSKVSEILSPTGIFWVILPPRQMNELKQVAQEYRLHLKDCYEVKDRPDKPIFRQVCSFGFGYSDSKITQLTLKEETGAYTPQYQSLLKGYLLGY